MEPASVVLRKCKRVKSGINAVTNPAIVVDLPAPLPPERVVTNSSKSKVRAKKPFQLIKVKERNLPRSTPLFVVMLKGIGVSTISSTFSFSIMTSSLSNSISFSNSKTSDIILVLRQILRQFHPHFLHRFPLIVLVFPTLRILVLPLPHHE